MHLFSSATIQSLFRLFVCFFFFFFQSLEGIIVVFVVGAFADVFTFVDESSMHSRVSSVSLSSRRSIGWMEVSCLRSTVTELCYLASWSTRGIMTSRLSASTAFIITVGRSSSAKGSHS